MKAKLSLVIVFFLVGCSSIKVVPSIPETEGVKASVNIDVRLLEDCADFSTLLDNPRPSDVLEQHGNDVIK